MDEKVGDSSFLQSHLWEQFQETKGVQTNRINQTLLLRQKLPFVGSYWYVPRGPKGDEGAMNIEQFVNNIISEAKNENVGWIRVEPFSKQDLHTIQASAVKILGENKVVKAPHNIQPRQTLCVDISMSEDNLLSAMKSKTRYNIRLAKKKGVTIQSTHEKKYIDIFYQLVNETSNRAGIKPHSLSHYQAMLKSVPEDNIQLYLAYYDDAIIAANLIIFYEDTAIYLHGGSSNAHRNVMAPFLLQWQSLLDAKTRGCKWYDFGGVNMTDEGNSWSGITRFKRGFSPETQPLSYPGTYDIILSSKKYILYKGISAMRAMVR